MEFVSPERSLEETCKLIGSSYADEQHSNLINRYTCQQDDLVEHCTDAPTGKTLLELAGNASDISALDDQSKDCMNDELQNSVMRSNPASPVPSLEQLESYSHDKTHAQKSNLQDDNTLYCSDQQQYIARYETVDLKEAEGQASVFSDNDRACIDSEMLLKDGDALQFENSTIDIPYVEDTSPCSPNLLERENLGESVGFSQEENVDVNTEKIHDPKVDSPSVIDVKHHTGGTSVLTEEMAAAPKADLQSLPRQLITPKTSPSKQNSLSSPVRLSPVQRSSDAQKSDKEPESCTKGEMEAPQSCSPTRRKHSRSPDRHGASRKRPSSRERSAPSKRQKSPAGKVSTRESRHKDKSPRHRSRSQRRRDSPHRRHRSSSRSPLRRRGSSRSKREQHHGRSRSRSRSPLSRDRRRRSPRWGRSPGRRSSPPCSHSHQRSPRRPWSPPANRKTGIGKPGRNLFVAGFSYATTERDLEKKFSKYGRVTDVRVVRDKRSGDCRGFGFLSLEKDEDADEAIRALDETEWNGRIILVEKSKTGAR